MKAVDSTLYASACREKGRDAARYGARERFFAPYVTTPNVAKIDKRKRPVGSSYPERLPNTSAPLKTRSLIA